MAGRVEGVYIAGVEGEPMRRVDGARAVAGRGLEGDRYYLGRGFYSGKAYPDEGRHITLVEVEQLEALSGRAGVELSAAESRRNVATRGVSLNELVGERFYVGEALCEGMRLCEPYLWLVELTRKPVLGPLIRRGGLRAEVVRGGRVGDGDEILPVAG